MTWKDPEIFPVRGTGRGRGRGRGRGVTVSQPVQVPRGGRRGPGRPAKKPQGRGRADPIQAMRTALSRTCKKI